MQNLNRDDIQALAGILDKAGRISITTHNHPDGDALGSSLGMARFLRSLGKEITVILPSPVPETLAFILKDDDCRIIVNEESPEDARAAMDDADLLLCTDFSQSRRVEKMEPAFLACKTPRVTIDHHEGPSRELFQLTIAENGISSASELCFWVLLALPQTGGDISRIPFAALEAFLTGMTTDTNNFANSTYPSTLEMASACLERGVDRNRIVSMINNQYRENRFRLQGYALSEKLHITPEGAAYMVLSGEELRRFDFREGETEGFVNIPLGIKEVRLSIFLRQEGDKFKVSTRSKEGTSARLFAAKWFDGGGHEMAAGGSLLINASIPDAAAAEKYIAEACKTYFNDEN